MMCEYCCKRPHNEDECHIKRCEPEKLKKAEEELHKNARMGKPEGGSHNPSRSPGKGNPDGGRRSSAPPTGARGALSPTPNGEQPGEKRTVTYICSAGGAEKNINARRASSTGTLSACRLLGWM